MLARQKIAGLRYVFTQRRLSQVAPGRQFGGTHRPVKGDILVAQIIQGDGMSELKVRCFAVSLDGYGAGPNQSLENPMGDGGGGLHTEAATHVVLRKD
jgi:hypothetical protein